MTAAPLLEVHDLSKAFPGVQALDEVSLDLRAGEILAVVGENGAGKSTLMKILAGIYSADGGEIRFDGKPLRLSGVADALRHGISLIHQELNLAENLSVAANLFLGRESTFGGPLGLLRQPHMIAESRRLMRRVGLMCAPTTIVGTLPPGQRQLVEIARALSMQVRILIMDEPTSSLTQKETETLYEVIEDLKSSDVAVVYISHRLAEVERLADRVVVLRDGCNAGELYRETKSILPTAIVAQGKRYGIAPDAGDVKVPSSDAIQELQSPRAVATDAIQESPGKTSRNIALDDQRISHESMVRLMVGRELSQFFKRKHATDFSTVRLELNRLRYRGVPGQPTGLSEPISLQLHAGEVLGMAGLMGAGRTELAEAIFGLRRVVAGSIRLDGRPVALSTPRHAIGAGLLLVPEDRRNHGLILRESIQNNISLPNFDLLSTLSLISRSKEKSLAQSLCERLRIRTPSIRQITGLLSGGNQQKVVLAKWLARQTRVLIVDEPTRGIDVGAKSEVYALLDNLAGDGMAILMISSDMEEILGMSDRVAVLHEGRLTGVLKRDDMTEEAIMHLATGGDRQ